MGCDKKLSLLSYNRLCELVEQKVIEGVPLENVNGASIDITLGNRFIFEKAVVDFTRNAQVVLKYRESFEPLEIEIVDEDSVILKPGEFVLAQSREIFNLPRNIAAEYKLKSSPRPRKRWRAWPRCTRPGSSTPSLPPRTGIRRTRSLWAGRAAS